jgi:serine/threonine-protein kinase
MMLYCPHCNGAVFLQSEDFQPGEVLGGFEIVTLLGKGGMGYVYLAKQSSMQRLVALKVIMKTLLGETDSNIIDMFNKEIQLSGTLNHPNIIKAIDAGENERCYFMAITYVDGEDFEKLLDRGETVPEKEAFAVALKMADALNYAWEKHGLIHKDIKPGNIIKDKKGEVFLMDMGIAQHMALGCLQNDKEVLGSPFYMSPEQGQGLPLDWRTDMYSLGATLYHMIVGVAPYDAKEVTGIIEKHIVDPFPEPADRNPDVSVSNFTIAILRKMMAKKTEDRYSSWEEFEQAVDNAFFSMPKISGESPIQRNNLYQNQKNIADKKNRISTVAAIINSLILIAVALLAAYFIYAHKKNSSAESNIRTAEQYYLKNPFDFNEVLRLFSIAKETSKGTKHYPVAVGRYNEMSEKAEVFKLKADKFDEAYAKARVLFMHVKFQEAVELMISVKDIEDPDRKQNAEKFIIQIRSAQASSQKMKGK